MNEKHQSGWREKLTELPDYASNGEVDDMLWRHTAFLFIFIYLFLLFVEVGCLFLPKRIYNWIPVELISDSVGGVVEDCKSVAFQCWLKYRFLFTFLPPCVAGCLCVQCWRPTLCVQSAGCVKLCTFSSSSSGWNSDRLAGSLLCSWNKAHFLPLLPLIAV